MGYLFPQRMVTGRRSTALLSEGRLGGRPFSVVAVRMAVMSREPGTLQCVDYLQRRAEGESDPAAAHRDCDPQAE